MLTQEQARQIVDDSIQEAGGRELQDEDQLLGALDLFHEERRIRFAQAVAQRVRGFQHELDPDIWHSLAASTTVADLTYKIMQLSVGKRCSGPAKHPQTCCPYPKTCPQCGEPVV
jgi:hypothetical protein